MDLLLSSPLPLSICSSRARPLRRPSLLDQYVVHLNQRGFSGFISPLHSPHLGNSAL
ncbi:MAG: hypothetical protein LBQ24_04855 [Candidatus Peribacteria bacterium]|nr:hypothetical protein [Candidatus Peribacteria bacterium]